MSDERTYTLAEAERALLLRDCAMYGHDWTTGPIALCETRPRFIVCERCGETASVEQPDDERLPTFDEVRLLGVDAPPIVAT